MSYAVLDQGGSEFHSQCTSNEAEIRNKLDILFKASENIRAYREEQIERKQNEAMFLSGVRDPDAAAARDQIIGSIKDLSKKEEARESMITCVPSSISDKYISIIEERCPIDDVNVNACAEKSYDGDRMSLINKVNDLEGSRSSMLKTLMMVKKEYDDFANALEIRNNSCSSNMKEKILSNQACTESLDQIKVDRALQELAANYCSEEALNRAKDQIARFLDEKARTICSIYHRQAQHRRSQRSFENESAKLSRSIACLESSGSGCQATGD